MTNIYMIFQENVYQFNNLSKYSSIIHGISTKAFGSMKRLDDLQINRNRLNKFAQSLGIIDEIICMQQVHSGNVVSVHDAKYSLIPKTDGMVTDLTHLPLAVITADCLPILLYDPMKNVIAVAHAGYKGLLHGIIGAVVHRMQTEFNIDSQDVIVGIGPSIETDCYEVGKELISDFQKKFPLFQNMFINKDGKFFLDLRAVAQQCLLREGILKEHVEIMDICTKCDPNFYSYRGGDGDNRFASMLSLV